MPCVKVGLQFCLYTRNYPECKFKYRINAISRKNFKTTLCTKNKSERTGRELCLFVKGATQNILEQVSEGFKKEGLEDLILKLK